MKTNLITLFFLLNLYSCHSDKYKLIENDELKSAFIVNSSPTFVGYFYMGSDSKFHYFESRWNFRRTRNFKIKKTDLIVNCPFEFSTKELRIDLYNISNIIFGKNKYYTLYFVKI